MDIFADDFARMDMKHAPKEEKEKDKKKEEEKFPVPVEKPGTVVAYECYRFAKLDSWERAGRQRLNVPSRELEARVKSQRSRGEPKIYEQMSRMSNFRAEQINRLLDDKSASTKDPHFEWVCASINSKKVSTKKGMYDVPSMDVILAKIVMKDTTPPKKNEPAKPKVPGELIDLSEKPDKKKDKEKDKDKDKDHKPHSPHYWAHDPLFADAGKPIDVHHAQSDPGFIKLGPVGGGHDGIEVLHEDGHQEHIPPYVPMAPPPRRSRSRHRPAPIPLQDPVLDNMGAHHPYNSSMDDDISVFFDDDGRSSRTSHSIDFEKIPRRGSLKPERRKSYREHHRNNSYSVYPRYNDWRSPGELAEVIPEKTYPRHHRPEFTRRRTLGYAPARPEITYHNDDLVPQVSHRSYSPPGMDWERERRDREIEDLERELELREREERLERAERDIERQKERRRQDLIDRLSRKSSGRDPSGYRF